MKPEWCEQWAWDKAGAVTPMGLLQEYAHAAQIDIARALLEAHQRGRREGMEEAAKIAEKDNGMAAGGYNPDFGPNVARRITYAIRAKAQGADQ